MVVTAALPATAAISATAITIVSAAVVTGEVIDGIRIVSFHSIIQEIERYTVVTSMMETTCYYGVPYFSFRSFACFGTYSTKNYGPYNSICFCYKTIILLIASLRFSKQPIRRFILLCFREPLTLYIIHYD